MHITVALAYGGTETMIARLIEADRGEHEHWVVGMMDDTSPDRSDTYSQRLERLGAKVFSLGVRRGQLSVRSAALLWRLYRDCRPALLSGWNYHGNIASVLLSLLSMRRVAAICNIRCSVQLGAAPSVTQRIFFWAHSHLSRLASATIFNSRRAADEHIRHGYAVSPIVIPNGFDIQRFRPDRELRQDMRGRLELAPDRVIVGSVGRFHRDKDHLTFLVAAEIAARARPELTFLIAGTGTEQIADIPAYRELIAVIGMDRVKILGHFADMPLLYNALDICVLSSTAEGFPNAVGEAMACGVPCVSTDVGDVAYLIGDTGFICPPSEPESLARGILSIAAGDRQVLGASARRRIEDNFSIAEVHQRFSKLWQAFVRGGNANVRPSSEVK